MKVYFVVEGEIDAILLSAIVRQVAKTVGVRWPVIPEWDKKTISVRKTGHGGALEKVRRIASDYCSGIYERPDILIVMIDHRKTEEARSEIAELCRNLDFVILAFPKEEIEAWWLGDRQQVLAWLNLSERTATSLGYHPGISTEGMLDPKSVLSSLTAESDSVDQIYGNGNIYLAEDFVENAWSNHINIHEVISSCPLFFRRFFDELCSAIRRISRLSASP
jgi:hypothetical protein